MNGQQPNHLTGYGMHPQILDSQYPRMLGQQQQAQGVQNNQLYAQGFYPQTYMQAQVQPQTILQNAHQQIQRQQTVNQASQLNAAQYYQFQMAQQGQTQHVQQPSQIQYYQQPQIHVQRQNSQDQQIHIQMRQQQQQAHAYQTQNQQQGYYEQQSQHHQQDYQFDQNAARTHRYQQQPASQQYVSQQHHPQQAQNHHKAVHKASPAKEAENSATHNEVVRKQRLEEEKQRLLERERKENERVQEELQARQRQANQIAQGVQGRLGQFKYPITFATCHVTTNLARLLPVPQENVQATTNLHCYDPVGAAQLLNSDADHDLIEYMSNLLQSSFDEVRSIQTKQNEGEANIYEADNLPTLMKNIHINSQYSFHIQSEFDDLTNDPDLERHFQAIADEVVSGGVVSDLLQLDDVSVDNLPSTSTATVNRHPPPSNANTAPISKTEDQRRQMSLLGKQPKGKGSGPPRRKRDMVGELIDSLTPFYDVSTDRRGRRRARGDDRGSVSDEENLPEQTQQDGKAKFFQKPKKQKKTKQEEEYAVRPPTPTEVLHQRDLEWASRQKERQDKLRRRHLQAEAEGHDASAESESQQKVENLMEQIFDQVGGFDVLNSTTDKSNLEDFLIERPVLEELRQEVSKLKMMRKLHKVNGDRLAKLVQMLEKNIRDVVDEEGNLLCSEILNDDDAGNETARELVHDRFIRAAEAGSLGLLIMTAHKMPKQVMVEDTVERATQLCKQMLRLVIFPAADSIVRNSKAKKTDERMKKRRTVGDGFNYWVQHIYVRIVEMIECFSELIRFQVLNDVVVVQLSTMATNPFFVDGIGDIHMVSIQLLSVIFRKFENLRPGIIQELLIAIHQIPSWKNPKNCYRLSNTEHIHNFTVLILQLIQSVVMIPVKRKNEDGEEEKPNEEDDSLISACFVEAKKCAAVFLKGFLHKCTAKAEEDYRKRFEWFLHDLLSALYRPEWPAAELMLTVLGNLLVISFRDKQLELSLRTACLDYLGTIAAKLKRDRVAAEKATGPHEKARLDVVVRGILYEEANDPTKLLDEIDTESLSSTEKIQKLQQALIDYLIATKSDNDVSAEYAISFYVGEWYKDTADDMKVACERHKSKVTEGLEGRDLKKEERRFQRIMEKCDEMKEFLIKLADKKSLKKRSHYIAKTGNYLIDTDAFWTVKYLASKKEFSQSFDSYLKYIVYGIQAEQSVGLRTKAMRCLTQIIEADHQVLAMPDVYNAVNARMMDMNVAVREATIELLGKYLISRPDLFDSYYSTLNDRIMDTGVAVRKRVIRIFREYVEKMPDSEKVPEILSKIIRRVSDEEGVKKLALETLMNIWFHPTHDKDTKLTKKVVTLIDAVNYSLKESKAEHIDNLFTTILKKDDIEKNVLFAARQIVDTLVDYVLNLDATIAEENNEELSIEQKTENEKKHQARLLSSLTTLSIISKVRPEIMVRHAEVFLPYLSMNVQTQTELQVLNQVINMLERIIPLMDHPSDSFLTLLDEKLCAIIKGQGMLLIQSAIACLGAVCKKWTRLKTKVSNVFLQYITFLKDIKTSMNDNINSQIPGNKRPTLMRCLFSVGPLVRYFDFDLIIDGNAPSPTSEYNAKRNIGVYPEAIYSILSFFVRSPVAEINQKAVTSLGHICAQYPEFFDRTDLRNMYQHLLSNNDEIYLKRKIEVLKNLHLFLTVEEERMIKAGEEYKRLRDAGELEDDLNATDTRGSLNSAIIQIFWKHVLSSYLHVNDSVRLAVSQVVYSTMMQGLVTPGDPLPTMIAMTTDPLPAIRNKIEGLVKEVDQKYSGMLASKAVRGIRWSFEMQKRLALAARKSYVLRGFRPTEHCSGNGLDEIGLPKLSSEAVAILNVLYTCLRTNRQQRRSFLNNVVRMFSEDYRETVGLEEMLFIADNLATFPYQLMDEPLFLIHTADSIISLSGQNVLSSFKEMLLPKHPGELLDEEDEFVPQNLYRRLPEDKTGIYELMKASQACFLLLYVKTYLKKLYRLSDAKVSAYSPSEAAKVYEKPIIRQSIPIFRPDLTLQELRPEVIAQRSTIEGHINLCEQIAYFRTMFYSLDIHDEGDEEEEKDNSDTNAAEPPSKKRRVEEDDDDEY